MDRLTLKIRLVFLAWLHHRSRPGSVSLVRRFSYKDIKRATDGFRRIIDNTSHGASYKAKFQDGRVAVVKEVKDFGEQMDAFYREVESLGRLHHRHIVALCGFSTGRQRFLILFKTPLSWRTRLQIAIGVAAALEYLYFFCDPPMYHVSISSSTIMLDENFNAKLSDVGFLNSGGNHDTLPHSSCSNECNDQVCGNIIFQLGLLILELITGQSSEKGDVDLIHWVQESQFPRSIYKMLDPDLGNNYDSKELKGLLAVARLCIKSADKPNFFVPQILRYLQKKYLLTRR
ncbi:hypothetical protein F0562_022363 [Nyssa sinensis]|uniref:Protein kinase domain-containing protein n=1 Tax=Nyssa sinensis TaxID=561372 RepID=A0A5J5BNH3_9ASTE|nr:hypothetical protein F0562_022363 [Nyssa sinensis]